MKHRYAAVLFLAAFLLQSTILHHIAIFGKTPNLLLCLVILFPFLYGGMQGAAFGIVFGLLYDISFSPVVGPTAIGFFMIAVFMAEFRKRLDWDNVLSIVIVAFTGTIAYYPLTWKIFDIVGGNYGFLTVLKSLPILGLSHFIVMILFYFVIGRRSVRHPQDKALKGTLLHIE